MLSGFNSKYKVKNKEEKYVYVDKTDKYVYIL